jgi:hypothetical protein
MRLLVVSTIHAACYSPRIPGVLPAATSARACGQRSATTTSTCLCCYHALYVFCSLFSAGNKLFVAAYSCQRLPDI